MNTKKDRAFWFILLFVCIVFIRNLAFWSEEQTFVFGDTAIFALYLSALAENFSTLFSLSDNFLFWNQNYLSIGLPTLSIIDLGYLYPPNTLLAFIAYITNNTPLLYPLLTVSALLHLTFGGYFVQRILKEYWKLDDFAAIVGGFLWVYIGFNIEYVAATSVIFSGSYLPICFYLNLRYKESSGTRYFFLFHIFLAMSFLVGYPMPAILILLMCIAYDLLTSTAKDSKGIWPASKKTLRFYIKGFFLVTLPIISPLYFTSIINFSRSVRGKVLSLEGFVGNSTAFSDLVEALLPLNTPFSSTSSTNVVHLYISFIVIAIVLQAKNKSIVFKDIRNFTLLILGLLGTIMALGGITSLPTLVYLSTPVVSFFRRLAIFSLIPGFAVCIIVPQYLKSAFSQKELPKSLVFGIRIVVLLLFLTQAARILYYDVDAPLDYVSLLQSLAIIFIVGTVAITALVSYKYNKLFAKSLLIAALLIEAGTVVASRDNINAGTNPADVFSPNDLTRYITQIASPSERVDILDTQHNYSSDYLGIEQTAGYVSLASEYGVRLNERFTASVDDYNAQNLRDILGVRYVLKKKAYDVADLKLLTQVPQNAKRNNFYSFNYTTFAWDPESTSTSYNVYENVDALPRLYLASRLTTVAAHSEEVLSAIEGLTDVQEVFLVGNDIKQQPISSTGFIDILEYKRNYIKAFVKANDQVFLANSTGNYRGWWVRVNDVWVHPVQVNWFMQGTYVPAGENIVEFVYIPYGVLGGGLYLLGVTIFWVKQKKHAYPYLYKS